MVICIYIFKFFDGWQILIYSYIHKGHSILCSRFSNKDKIQIPLIVTYTYHDISLSFASCLPDAIFVIVYIIEQIAISINGINNSAHWNKYAYYT